jgi:hypothetical protein
VRSKSLESTKAAIRVVGGTRPLPMMRWHSERSSRLTS